MPVPSMYKHFYAKSTLQHCISKAFGSWQALGSQTSLNPSLFYTSYIGKSVLLLNQSLDLSRATKLSTVHCHFQIRAEIVLTIAGSQKGIPVHFQAKCKPIFQSKAVKCQG